MKLLSERFPNGITKAEAENLSKEIFNRTGGYDNYKKWSKEDRILQEELKAVSMLESLFVYGYNVKSYFFDNSYSNGYGGYAEKATGYIESYIIQIITNTSMTREDALTELTKVYENQMKLFKTTKIHRDVYEDSEGVTYNSLEY